MFIPMLIQTLMLYLIVGAAIATWVFEPSRAERPYIAYTTIMALWPLVILAAPT